MKGEWVPKKDNSKEDASSKKEKFDLDKFLKESVKAGEILEKKEREKEREHVEV